jgi:ABC-2 type transport system ATP-binding protein
MLELRQVTKKFSVFPAVNRVSFCVQPGEIIGYLGPNGAGKSTTLKMLAGLLDPTSGSIEYQGRSIRDDLYSYKTKIGYVPENAEIYPHLTAYEYLLMVGRLRLIPDRVLKDKILNLLESFGLALERDLAISSYSKGMVQKVLLTSALLHDPEVLLMDEPLSGLDVTTGLVIKDLVRMLAESGKIIIYSSHVLEVVEKVCSRAVIIHQGAVVADDSVENLRNLMQLPNLEDIFSQLVVREDTEARAREILGAIRVGAG